jgi:hypothetical protein
VKKHVEKVKEKLHVKSKEKKKDFEMTGERKHVNLMEEKEYVE